MAGSNGGAPKARALGRALAEVRNERRVPQRWVAEKIGRGAGTVARWELGERAPDPTDVAQLLTVLEVSGERYDEILAMARGTLEPRWLAVTLPELQQQLAALLSFERDATAIADVAPLLIPGLLQTADYTRAIMTSADIPECEIETRVAMRVGRRETLQRRTPTHLTAFIGEMALHTVIGAPEVMADQLHYLITMSRRPNVDLRIVPINAGWHPGLEGPFKLIEFDKPRPVVYLELRDTGLFLHEPSDADSYRRAIDNVARIALSQQESVTLITQEITRLEGS
jgi:transcriptional regulator with XRE-family HTH domain